MLQLLKYWGNRHIKFIKLEQIRLFLYLIIDSTKQMKAFIKF